MIGSLWKRSPSELIFAAIWIACAFAIGHLLFGTLDSRLVFVLPGICVVAYFFRISILFRLFPFFVLALIGSRFHLSQTMVGSFGSTLLGLEPSVLGIVSLITIAIGARLQTLLIPVHQKVVTERIIYSPTQLKPGLSQVANSYFVSLLFIVCAWLLAGYLNSQFAWATQNTSNFENYRSSLRQGIRLVPWAFNGIRLTIYLATLFAVIHGLLSYVRCRNNNGQMGAMLLRHELWKWNRWEQKAVAKAARKYS